MSKTLQLSFPEWQGGDNKNYAFGCKLLSWLVPESNTSELVEVPVATDYDVPQPLEDGIVAKSTLIKQQKIAYDILEEKQPDKVIVLGGDCSVSQAPFDYLHGKYPKDTGILWIDVHPDISMQEDGAHEHAMVLGNLLGGGVKDMAEMVMHPFEAKSVMYAGLKAEEMHAYEREHVATYGMNYVGPKELKQSTKPVMDWIKENGFKHILIHWDLDVLTPEDFRSLLCNEPHLGEVSYAVGDMKLKEIISLIQDVEQQAEVVCLSIAEYMPWDVIALKKGFSKLNIFK